MRLTHAYETAIPRTARRVLTGTLVGACIAAAVPATAAAAPPVQNGPGPGIAAGQKNGAVGDTLTESHAAWANNPTSYAVQWQRCTNPNDHPCPNISGETAQTYTIVEADRGYYLRVQEVASNADGASAPVETTLSPAVTSPTEFASGSVPQIQGTATPSQTLTITPAQVTPDGVESSFQFLRCDANGQNCAPGGPQSTDVPPTYAVTTCDSGSTLVVEQVAGSNTSQTYNQRPRARSAPTAIVPTQSWKAPCGGALMKPTAQRDASSHPVTDDAGMLVTGKLDGVMVTGKFVAGPFTHTATPMLGSRVGVGTTLTVQGHQKWDRADPDRGYHYQWYARDNKFNADRQPIAGATGTSYTVTANDLEKSIEVEERTFNDAGEGLLGAAFPVFIVSERDPSAITPGLVAQVSEQALKGLTAPMTTRKALLASGTYRYGLMRSPGEGRMAVTWSRPARAKAAKRSKRVVFAKGSITTPAFGGPFVLAVKLTKKGKAQLKASKKTTALTATVTFTPKSGKASTRARRFSIKR